jgi:hypothetical protein
MKHRIDGSVGITVLTPDRKEARLGGAGLNAIRPDRYKAAGIPLAAVGDR